MLLSCNDILGHKLGNQQLLDIQSPNCTVNFIQEDFFMLSNFCETIGRWKKWTLTVQTSYEAVWNQQSHWKKDDELTLESKTNKGNIYTKVFESICISM